jgi:hypothetical protein
VITAARLKAIGASHVTENGLSKKPAQSATVTNQAIPKPISPFEVTRFAPLTLPPNSNHGDDDKKLTITRFSTEATDNNMICISCLGGAYSKLCSYFGALFVQFIRV